MLKNSHRAKHLSRWQNRFITNQFEGTMSDLSNTDSSIQLVDRTTVEKMTSLSKTQIYALMQEGKFPRQINLSARSVAWILAEINQWINDRKRDRDIKYSRTDSQ